MSARDFFFGDKLIRDCDIAANKCTLCHHFGHEEGDCPMLRKTRVEVPVLLPNPKPPIAPAPSNRWNDFITNSLWYLAGAGTVYLCMVISS